MLTPVHKPKSYDVGQKHKLQQKAMEPSAKDHKLLEPHAASNAHRFGPGLAMPAPNVISQFMFWLWVVVLVTRVT